MAAGVVVLLFVVYQLWGTGLREAQAQDDLTQAFAQVTASAPALPTNTPAPLPPPEGEAVAIIRIPKIGVEKAVVEGVGVADLKKGPGHYPTTPVPGQPGNAAIAGHRTTYGAPFGELGELVEGDEILVTTRQGEFRYVVDRISIVSPEQVEVLDPSEESRLTLTTCHPRYSARQRLIVSGVLAGDPAPAPPTTVPEPPLADEEPADDGEQGDDDPVLAEPPAALDDPSLAGDPAARGPAAAWGAATALVALGAWLVGQRWRRWPAYLLSLPLGAVTLFLCFEQIARLLPSNI
jgi:sortase A